MHFEPRELLFRRHIRYILASYFYVLTVASIVHLGDELPRDMKWLWPSAVGTLVICAATASGTWWRRFRARATRWGIATTIAVSLLLGIYAGCELIAGRKSSPFGNEGNPAPASPPIERTEGAHAAPNH
jgi:Na+/proline symporter